VLESVLTEVSDFMYELGFFSTDFSFFYVSQIMS